MGATTLPKPDQKPVKTTDLLKSGLASSVGFQQKKTGTFLNPLGNTTFLCNACNVPSIKTARKHFEELKIFSKVMNRAILKSCMISKISMGYTCATLF
jgi:hypothetical protein